MEGLPPLYFTSGYGPDVTRWLRVAALFTLVAFPFASSFCAADSAFVDCYGRL